MRRRKPKVVWLPPTNVNSIDANNSSSWSFVQVAFDATAVGNIGAIEVPIVMDGNQSDPLDATSSLADIESSGYRLRRICGKLWILLTTPVDQQFVTGLYGISAGLIVRRVDPGSGGSLAAAADPTFSEIDPAHIRNAGDPWIWRRDYLLNDGIADLDNVAVTQASQTALFGSIRGTTNINARTGSLHEGPHIDQKTARIVGPEERLFLDVSATTMFVGTSANQTMMIFYQFRTLASMRQNIGNRRNASR